MDISVMGDKLIVADNFFSAQEFAIAEQEIAALRPHLQPTYHGSDVILYRLSLDQAYQDRKRSFLLQAIQSKIYSNAILNVANGIHDLSYTLMNMQHKFITALTEMRGDTDYRTHTDTGDKFEWTRIFMSWIWYYNPDPAAMTGGELNIEDLGLSVEPVNNRLVLLPAYLRHSISKPVFTRENYYRTTVNGFFSLADASILKTDDVMKASPV